MKFKYFVFSIFLVLSASTVSAQSLCQVSASSLQSRYTFLVDLEKKNKDLLELAKKTHKTTKETLNAMENAHLASDIAQTISAVAGLVAGGAAIGTLYFQGGTVSFMGMFTIQSGSVAAHAYSAYAIGSNLLTLGQAGYNVLKEGESVEDLLQKQMKDLEKKGLFLSDAIKFVMNPNWNGPSTLLRSPIIENAINKLERFYEQKKREIGPNHSFWGYLGEFWHERGLKLAALDEAVTKEMKTLQEMRLVYISYLKTAVAQHYNSCYR